ncbi:MAG: PIN-like domain-containing protein [Alcanivorax sp.]|uniref:PIN-like domain-containing protein n=1 Tax=Alcanivorax sp. TaxID=1872427 RepID=UPI003DA71DAC
MDRIFQTYREDYGKDIDLKDGFSVSYDTSTILDLYRLSDNSREEVLSLFEKIERRVGHFVTHYVAFEVSKNKEMAKKDSEVKINDIKQKFSSFKKSLNGNARAGGYSTPFDELSKEVRESLEEIHKSIEAKTSDIKRNSSFNSLYGRFSKMFSGKVSSPFSGEDLRKIIENGAVRYSCKIPPGFADDAKSDFVNFFGDPIESKYGDLIIWEHLISWAAKNEKNIIFITSDQKDDWVESRKIRPDLAAEFNKRTGFSIYIFTLSEFENTYKKFLGSKLSESSKTELEIIEGEYENWLNEVVGAFEDLGGEASLRELYDYISKNTMRSLSAKWHSTVRRTIYYHSSDVEAYQGKRDIFQRVGSGRSGKWKLRNIPD